MKPRQIGLIQHYQQSKRKNLPAVGMAAEHQVTPFPFNSDFRESLTVTTI